MIKLAVVGCQGRMGQRITELSAGHKDLVLHALVESPELENIPSEIRGVKVSRDINAIRGADVLIDFTLPEVSMRNLRACQQHRVRMVIGTTGFTAEQDAEIMQAAMNLGIVRSSNMSVGVNVLFGVLRRMAEALKGYNVSITETHHVHKKDAPSGTAKTMAELIANSSNMQNVPVSSVREGEVIGYHEVTFESPVDTIKLSHNAKTRDMFAEGSLIAAKYVAFKDNGLYSMQDVLGLI